jgi:hypothetical protein
MRKSSKIKRYLNSKNLFVATLQITLGGKWKFLGLTFRPLNSSFAHVSKTFTTVKVYVCLGTYYSAWFIELLQILQRKIFTTSVLHL